MQRPSLALLTRQNTSRRGKKLATLLIVLLLCVLAAFSYPIWVPKAPRFTTGALFSAPRPHYQVRGPYSRGIQQRKSHGFDSKGQLDSVDVWAAGIHQSDPQVASALWGALTAEEQDALMKLCGRYRGFGEQRISVVRIRPILLLCIILDTQMRVSLAVGVYGGSRIWKPCVYQDRRPARMWDCVRYGESICVMLVRRCCLYLVIASCT